MPIEGVLFKPPRFDPVAWRASPRWMAKRHARRDNAREGGPAVLPLLAVALPFLAQRFGREPLQPYETRSVSGAWVLEVRPTHPDGTGPMRARILHGQEV